MVGAVAALAAAAEGLAASAVAAALVAAVRAAVGNLGARESRAIGPGLRPSVRLLRVRCGKNKRRR